MSNRLNAMVYHNGRLYDPEVFAEAMRQNDAGTSPSGLGSLVSSHTVGAIPTPATIDAIRNEVVA